MQKNSALIFKDNQPYPNVYIRLFVCLMVSHFIVSYGEPENLFQLLKLQCYYPALGGSFLITLTISEFIHYCNLNLDSKFSWRKDIYKRMLSQALICFFSAIILAVCLASIYFKLNHISITKTSYFRYDFTIIIFFVALLNLFVVVVNLFELKFLTRKNLPNKLLLTDSELNKIVPAIIYSDDRICFDLTFKGEKLSTYKSLKEALKVLPHSDFFMVNRSLVVNRLVIKEYLPAESNTLKLLLYSPFEDKTYYVSQRNAVAFKRWFLEESRMKE